MTDPDHRRTMSDDSDEHGSSTPPAGDSGPDPFAGPDWESERRRSSRSRAEALAAAERGESGEVRVRRERRRRSTYARRRRRRRILLGGAVVVLALVAAGTWLLYSGLKARNDLEAARAEVHQLRAQIADGDLDAARTTADELRRHAADAHDATTGPIWAPA